MRVFRGKTGEGLGGHLPDQRGGVRPRPRLPEASDQADDLASRPAGGQHRVVHPAGDAQDGECPPVLRARSGQSEHAAGHLAAEGGRVEVALAGHHDVGGLQPGRQTDQAGDEVESRLNASTERDESAGQAAGRAGTRDVGDVHADFPRR